MFRLEEKSLHLNRIFAQSAKGQSFSKKKRKLILKNQILLILIETRQGFASTLNRILGISISLSIK